jgi:hypothetical protein
VSTSLSSRLRTILNKVRRGRRNPQHHPQNQLKSNRQPMLLLLLPKSQYRPRRRLHWSGEVLAGTDFGGGKSMRQLSQRALDYRVLAAPAARHRLLPPLIARRLCCRGVPGSIARVELSSWRIKGRRLTVVSPNNIPHIFDHRRFMIGFKLLGRLSGRDACAILILG